MVTACLAVPMAAAPPGSTGPAAKIKELKDLLDVGAISQEEFDSNKARLLEALHASA